MFYIFDTLVRPILMYGSDVWGISKKGLTQVDKVFLQFARCVLHVKSTTCNTIVYGECGRFPPSVLCQINTLCFLNRVANASESKIVKLVFEELRRLGDQGFQTWISKACELANSCGIESNMITCSDKDEFKIHCKQIVMNKYINVWQQELIAQTKPILRTYSLFKNELFTEHHLELITYFRYRAAITKLRCNSHALEIERGRYQNPKVPRDLRLCLTCKVVEDENHFVTKCSIN